LCYAKWVLGNPKPKLNELNKLQWFSLKEARKLDKDDVSKLALRLFEETL